mgnify:CR=1 FL=1
MSAAGSDARNAEPAMRPSAAKIWVCPARSITAAPPAQRMGIGIKAIRDTYLPRGFTQFKIEGRGLGSALILEFLLHYLTKPEYQLAVREELYLDTMLDLF